MKNGFVIIYDVEAVLDSFAGSSSFVSSDELEVGEASELEEMLVPVAIVEISCKIRSKWDSSFSPQSYQRNSQANTSHRSHQLERREMMMIFSLVIATPGLARTDSHTLSNEEISSLQWGRAISVRTCVKEGLKCDFDLE